MTDSDTRTIPISGRDITVRKLTETQLILLAREAKQVQKESNETDRKVTAAARLFDIMESTVVTEADQEFVLQEIIAGKVELKDLLAGISAFAEEQKPKVRRGRPPAKRV